MTEQRPGGRYASLFLPAVVAQSLISGGGYASGREVTQYAGRFGPQGWLGVALILLGFSLLAAIVYELARLYGAYDYKRFVRLLVGPLWPLFDLLTVLLLLLVIAVMTDALSTVLGDTLGLPRSASEVISFATISFALFRGTTFIERFKTVGTVALYLAYAAFTVLVLALPAQAPPAGALPPAVSTGGVVVSAIQYVGYNLSVFPALLYCLYRQRDRATTISSGVLSGLAMTIPFAATMACLLRFWPSEAVLEAPVPWLVMLESAGDRVGATSLLAVVYSAVLVVALLDTGVGGIHALLDRVDKNLGDLPAFLRPAAGSLSPRQRALVALAILLGTTLLARVGITDLVARGYGALAWGYIVLLALPLLTVGVWRIARRPAA